MMQTTEPRHGNHLRVDRRALCGRSAGRSFFAQAEMSSVVMIVVDIFPHETFQMALIKNDDVVKKIATAGAYPPLGHTILPGASNRGANREDAQTLYGLQHLTMESVLAIKD